MGNAIIAPFRLRLNLLSKGHTYKLIADEFSVSIDTIRTHLRRIYEKLHVQSRTEAVANICVPEAKAG